VTGVDELVDDGDGPTPIQVAVDPAASDDDFDALPPQTLTAVTIDDDVAGFTVVVSDGGTLVTEAGTTDDFTVVLTSEPVSDVVLEVVSGDAGEAAVAPATLTFTPADWDTPQTVTVTGVDDLEDDGTQFTDVTVSIDAAASDDAFDSVLPQTVSVTTDDDDSPTGFTVTAIGGTTVTEGGGTDDFTVVLDTEPATDVVFDVTSSDVGEAAVAPTTLTFTNADWDTPQTVTVTGVDDDIIDGGVGSTVSVSVDDAASDDAFDALPDQTVAVITSDDDVAGFTVSESGGSTLVSEGGTTDDFTVVLDAEPASDVVISATSGDLGEASVTPIQLTFTPTDWDTPQTVTVTGEDDLQPDGTQTTGITLAVVDPQSDDDFDGVIDQVVDVQTTDDDQPGITLTETGPGTTVTEAGGTDDFTVVLNAEPLTDVVLDVVSADPGEVTLFPTTLTFTNANWDTPQTVTATGVDDDIIDPDEATTITVSIDVGASDPAYGSVGDETLIATTTDDDIAGFAVAESGAGSTVDEGGTTDDFTIVLDAEPASDVVLDVTSGDVGEVTVAPATVTFTAADWDTPQQVTVTGVDDLEDDGDVVTPVTIAVDAAQSDDDFDAVASQDVAVTTTDDDNAGITVAESGPGTTVDESGGTDAFTVVLDAQPVADVVLDVTSADTGEATVAPTQLTFTNGDWDTPQTVTVTGVDDDLADGDVVTDVTISVDDASSDDAYDPVPDQTVSVTNTDDDPAGFTVTESAGATQVDESGATDDFTVVLDAQPTLNVVLNVASGDASEATVDVSNLVFTNANWDTPQTVTVTGVDDDVDDDDQVTTLTISVDAGASDDAFDALADQTVDATTTDDDDAGFTLSESGGSTVVSESATTDEFTVVLTSEPLSDVVFTVTATDAGEATAAPATLTFTPGNWSTAQTVTVTGVDDPLVDGNVLSDVDLAVDDANSDDAYDPLPDQSVSVTTTDDDAPGFAVTESGPGTTVTEAGGTDTFEVVLSAQPATDVVFDVGSGDPEEVVVDQTQLTFTNANWDTPQTVTLTGVDDSVEDGDQVTTVTVSVGSSLPLSTAC